MMPLRLIMPSDSATASSLNAGAAVCDAASRRRHRHGYQSSDPAAEAPRVACCRERRSPASGALGRFGPAAPTDAVVLETERRDICRIVLVAPVEDDRRAQVALDLVEVRIPELLPFGHEQHRVGAFERFVSFGAERELAVFGP